MYVTLMKGYLITHMCSSRRLTCFKRLTIKTDRLILDTYRQPVISFLHGWTSFRQAYVYSWFKIMWK